MVSLKGLYFWKCAAIGLSLCLLFSVGIYPVLGKAADNGTIQNSTQQRTINVTGSADVMVAPDEVDITVGIETRDIDFKKANSENYENSKKVIDLTKKYGIDSKHVQSDYIRTYPSYNYEQGKDTTKVSFYNVQKRIVIKLKDISKFEALTSDLMDNGTILIQNIDFRSTELAKYKNEARRLAVRAANDKAKLLTSELDCDIGKPINISEEQLDNLTWYGSWWGSSWYGYGNPNAGLSNVMANYQSNQAGGGQGQTGETIAIGQIKVTVRIGVVFELN